MEPRPIYQIAEEIKRNWRPVHPTAQPYLEAMFSLDKITDSYGFDTGKSVVLYFLSNSSTWRGEVARRIKDELKAIAKVKR